MGTSRPIILSLEHIEHVSSSTDMTLEKKLTFLGPFSSLVI